MSHFHKDEEHKAFALLFDSHKIEDRFNARNKGAIPHLIIKDKEEKRISSMLESIMDLKTAASEYYYSGMQCVVIANSIEEAIACQLGSFEPQGLAICLSCLRKAITAHEESLTVLKDIEEATKKYAAKF